jgi:hypothetical protein
MTQPLPPLSEILSDKDSETSSTTALTKKNRFPNRAPEWKPGQSGNPAGRPVGAKNRITAARLGIEAQLREQVNEYMPEIMGKAIELALDGDKLMIKTLLELCISKAAPVEDESGGKDRIQVTIRKLDKLEIAKPEPENTIIDVTPERANPLPSQEDDKPTTIEETNG